MCVPWNPNLRTHRDLHIHFQPMSYHVPSSLPVIVGAFSVLHDQSRHDAVQRRLLGRDCCAHLPRIMRNVIVDDHEYDYYVCGIYLDIKLGEHSYFHFHGHGIQLEANSNRNFLSQSRCASYGSRFSYSCTAAIKNDNRPTSLPLPCVTYIHTF